MPSLFGLFGNDDRRRPTRARTSPPMAPQRRYELPRAEPPRASMPAPRRTHRPGDREVSWRFRGMVALAVLGVTGILGGGIALYRSDALRVRVIDVGGVQVADAQAVADASKVAGSSMLTLDLTGSARAVEQLPAVKSATVTRDWPQGIRIEITEYQAWGYWQAGSERLVIDETGRVLQQSRPPVGDAPTIVEVPSGGTTQNVAADADTVRLVHRMRTDGTFDRLGVKPTSYVFRRDRGLTVLVSGAPAAVFGDSSNYDFTVRTWQALMEQVRAGKVPQVQAPAQVSAAQPRAGTASTVQEIDLRFGRNVVLR